MEAKGRAQKHINQTKSTLTAMFEGCGFIYWSDISATRLESYLADLREEQDLSARTFNHKMKTAKQFCTWMTKNGRAAASPLLHLETINEQTDKRVKRRSLEPDEIRYLLEVTAGAETRCGMMGHERAMLYRLACETGIRAGEARSLRVSSFDFSAKTVTIQAAYSKRKRADTIPLRPDTAATLKSFFKNKLPGAKAFNMPDKAGRMLKTDLDAVRSKWIDEAKHIPKEYNRRQKSDFIKDRDRSRASATSTPYAIPLDPCWPTPAFTQGCPGDHAALRYQPDDEHLHTRSAGKRICGRGRPAGLQLVQRTEPGRPSHGHRRCHRL
jgi:integrase